MSEQLDLSVRIGELEEELALWEHDLADCEEVIREAGIKIKQIKKQLEKLKAVEEARHVDH